MPMLANPIRHGCNRGYSIGTRPGGVSEGGTARPVHLPDKHPLNTLAVSR